MKANSSSGGPISQPITATDKAKVKERTIRSSSGVSGPGESSFAQEKVKGKERRAAAGTEAMRNQIMKQAVGGPSNPNDANLYQVSDSEEEEDLS